MIQALGDQVRKLGTLGRRFWHERSGATAVEFGLIGIPFFFMKMAIIETAIIFLAGQSLESGVGEASRMIRTGQVQTQGLGEAEFRNIVCGQINFLLECGPRLAIDVQRVDRVDEAEMCFPVDTSSGTFNGAFGYDPGVGGQTVIVRAYYLWPIIFNFMGLDNADVGGRQRLLVATTAFRNEPF
ncbi:MAG: TadE/TadG family type IV pilus assembly protein [Cohaesibacteraceae bacterium]